MLTKNELRKEMLEKRLKIPTTILSDASETIARRLSSLAAWKDAKTIYAYMDAKNEIMTENMISLAWQQGKKVALPRVKGKEMDFYVIASFSECEKGCFGIMEPKKECAAANDETALVIVPGIAFDSKCNRIGYGKGYYDRFLSVHRKHRTAGVAGSWQIVEEIEAEDNDIRMDYLITETEIHQTLGEV